MTSAIAPASAPSIRRIDLQMAPLDVVRRWPKDRALAALVSGGPPSRWSRWSILACPELVRTFSTADGAALVESLRRPSRQRPEGVDLPFLGGVIASLRYEAGACFEPAVEGGDVSHSATILDCPGALIHDKCANEWWEVGESELALRLSTPQSCDSQVHWHPTADEAAYIMAVESALEYIRAGDVYQVNLSHALRATIDADPRALFAQVAQSLGPWYGAFIDEGASGESTLCWSPELLASLDAQSRTVVTRPIKGTRRAGGAPDELLASEKDAAELAMIVDLMRNDLGRIAEYGSVRVVRPRDAERHAGESAAGVLHTVATIAATMREGEDASSLLRALFPAGSITGAPKIRAMQIIRELEGRTRGAYCGSVGYISDCGAACFNVAIRTASISGIAQSPSDPFGRLHGVLRLPVGAGIVADSDPEREWQESLDKAAAIVRATQDRSGASP